MAKWPKSARTAPTSSTWWRRCAKSMKGKKPPLFASEGQQKKSASAQDRARSSRLHKETRPRRSACRKHSPQITRQGRAEVAQAMAGGGLARCPLGTSREKLLHSFKEMRGHGGRRAFPSLKSTDASLVDALEHANSLRIIRGGRIAELAQSAVRLGTL